MTPLDKLADNLMQRAKAANLTIVAAESCSAGRLAQAFSQAEGASQHFMGSFVTYAKDTKASMLSVPAATLAQETAVSPGVAEAMARGALTKAGASLAVAITGVTGPEPDEDGNPVGLVYCAVTRAQGGTKHIRLELGNQSREELIERSCTAALQLLREFAFS
jgi:nicotinamide-nucleotide amidase